MLAIAQCLVGDVGPGSLEWCVESGHQRPHTAPRPSATRNGQQTASRPYRFFGMKGGDGRNGGRTHRDEGLGDRVVQLHGQAPKVVHGTNRLQTVWGFLRQVNPLKWETPTPATTREPMCARRTKTVSSNPNLQPKIGIRVS